MHIIAIKGVTDEIVVMRKDIGLGGTYPHHLAYKTSANTQLLGPVCREASDLKLPKLLF